MKKLVLVYVVLIFAVILLAIFKAGGNINLPSFGKKATAQINGQKINLLLTKSENERQKGLSGRKNLDQNQGMLFIFDKPDRYGFWMKGMLFPIDIIYINGSKVVYVVRSAPSSVQVPNLTIYRPDAPANYVLELNAGSADKLKIQSGTKVILKGL